MFSNDYRHPKTGLPAAIFEFLANSRSLASWRRMVLARLPFVVLESEVRNVVYLTWLVPVERCRDLVPPAAKLWQRNGLTPFTVLTYRHLHFGPALIGPGRRLFPSPLQSNWRLYLDENPLQAESGRTVLFLKNIISSPAYALAARLCSDALPTHLPESFVHHVEGETIRTGIAAGTGSSPSLTSLVHVGGDKALDPFFTEVFSSWTQAIDFLACQDAAIAPITDDSRLAYAEIELPIDLATVLPASAAPETLACSMLGDLAPVGEPLCFIVPKVSFRVKSEQLIP